MLQFAGAGSVAEQQAFFKTVIPWMEGNAMIERYAGFGTLSPLSSMIESSVSDTDIWARSNRRLRGQLRQRRWNSDSPRPDLR